MTNHNLIFDLGFKIQKLSFWRSWLLKKYFTTKANTFFALSQATWAIQTLTWWTSTLSLKDSELSRTVFARHHCEYLKKWKNFLIQNKNNFLKETQDWRERDEQIFGFSLKINIIAEITSLVIIHDYLLETFFVE